MMSHTTTARAFTLIETLVAIAVIMLAIAGPFYAVQQALNVSRGARDQLIASFLAQEAIEFSRAIRDNNYLYLIANPSSGRSWLFGINGTNSSTNCITAPCVVDPLQNTVSRTIAPLRLNEGGVYTQSTSASTVTSFTRTLQLVQVSGSSTEMIVRVIVTWVNRAGTTETFQIEDRLHNWL